MLQNKHNPSVNKQNLFRQVVLLNVTATESEEISFVFLHFISGKMFFISPQLTIYNNLGDKVQLKCFSAVGNIVTTDGGRLHQLPNLSFKLLH